MFPSKRKFMDNSDIQPMGLRRPRFESGPPFFAASPALSAMGDSSYGYTSEIPPFPVVRLRGLPFDCTEVDILDFFSGLDIIDVLFVHKGGRFTGEAFCVFAYPLQVDFALQRNRENMGRRYVEVFRSKRQEYYSAIAHEVSGGKGSSPRRAAPSRPRSVDIVNDNVEHTGILRMRGLPYSAGKNEIAEFFKDYVLLEDSTHICLNSDGRPTGEAYVVFATPEDSKAAMKKDRMTLGSRYVELFLATREEMDEVISGQ